MAAVDCNSYTKPNVSQLSLFLVRGKALETIANNGNHMNLRVDSI